MKVETDYRKGWDYWRAYRLDKKWYGYKRSRFYGIGDTEARAIYDLKQEVERRNQKGGIYEV